MSTQAHPNILGALAALHDLADQHRWLGELLEPGPTGRRPRASLTPAGHALLNRQARAEKADLVETRRQGLAPRGASPAPLNLDVLAAQIGAVEAVMHAAWRTTSALHTMADAPRYTGGGHTDQARFDIAFSYLTPAILLVDPDTAGDLEAGLNEAARTARIVTRAEPDRADFNHGPCPACGRRSLVLQTVTTFDPALITCTRPDCRCRGIDCLCRRPGRQHGQRHIWPSAEFGQLRVTLERRAA